MWYAKPISSRDTGLKFCVSFAIGLISGGEVVKIIRIIFDTNIVSYVTNRKKNII